MQPSRPQHVLVSICAAVLPGLGREAALFRVIDFADVLCKICPHQRLTAKYLSPRTGVDQTAVIQQAKTSVNTPSPHMFEVLHCYTCA